MAAIATSGSRRRATSAVWTVYVLRCGDGSLYTGITNALEARVKTHRAGRGAKYTRSRLPVTLAWSRRCPTATAARRLEYAIKRLAREAKLRLIAGDAALWRALRRGAEQSD
jgi:putative endonuclease